MTSKANNKLSFEKQLDTLIQLGFKLNKGIAPDDILIHLGKDELKHNCYEAEHRWIECAEKINSYSKDAVLKQIGREEIENIHPTRNPPFELLCHTLGESNEVSLPFTNQCWYVDDFTLRNQPKNNYQFILENLARISNNELNFKHINCKTNPETQKVCVSFKAFENNYNWEFQQEKWPTKLFYNIEQLANIHNYNKRLAGLFFNKSKPSDGVVLSWLTQSQKDKIIDLTNLNIQWLHKT